MSIALQSTAARIGKLRSFVFSEETHDMDLESLEAKLDRFDRGERRQALAEIAGGVKAGGIPAAAATGAVNVHLHTFFSFNARGWSPSRVVWEARKTGLQVVGTVDFDVLDAVEEVFEAADLLDLRAVAALETRVFMSEYAEREINSPGEPGVSYFMGTGFASVPPPSSPAGQGLSRLRDQARQRNQAMLERLNRHLAPLQVDYRRDVLPLTPAGNATERHMLAALDGAARALFPAEDRLSDFWGRATGVPAADLRKLLADPVKLRNLLRAKLMKKGGAGYVQPDRTTFPPIEEVIGLVLDGGAIPCATWLDGTSTGEGNAGELLDHYLSLGCLALNIIPDRNWNLSDPAEKALKTGKLREVVEAARRRHLILSVGTEMNSFGQRFVDDFAAPELAPFAAAFRDGALTLHGHTVLQRTLGHGRTSKWAGKVFGPDRAKANQFYRSVGRLAFPPRAAREKLKRLEAAADPDAILEALA
jgi:hypothetical protein